MTEAELRKALAEIPKGILVDNVAKILGDMPLQGPTSRLLVKSCRVFTALDCIQQIGALRAKLYTQHKRLDRFKRKERNPRYQEQVRKWNALVSKANALARRHDVMLAYAGVSEAIDKALQDQEASS